ncbi:MAG: sulfate permease [Pseudomonadota bacterium]
MSTAIRGDSNNKEADMLRGWLPGLAWLEGYERRDFHSDLVSGLTISFMLIPQGMGYAVVAGLPPEVGLYACIFPPVVYALLGTSNKISIGPVALDSILILSGLSVLADPGSDRYLELAVTMTLMVGCIQAAFGWVKLGVIGNFLSYPVIVGYTSAAAVVIMGSQLDSLFGVDLGNGNLPQLVFRLLGSFESWNLPTLALGVMGVCFMVFPQRVLPGLPYALLLLVIGMLASGTWQAESLGVEVIDDVPRGLPQLVLPNPTLDDLRSLLPISLTVALMGYVGSMSICKSLEKPTDRVPTQPNQELIAVGAANLLGALFRAFPVSASFSRSAAFRHAGARTQISAVVSSACIALTVLFLTPLFARFPLPKALLAAIIVVSVAGLLKVGEMRKIARESPREFWILLATFMTTVFLGVQNGLLMGVALSLAMVVYNTATPHMTELGAIQGGRLYRNTSRFPEAVVRQDVLIFRFDAPLFFANKDYFKERVCRWVSQREPDTLKYIIFDAEAVNSLDNTATQMLQQLIENFDAQGVEFYISNPIGPVRDAIKGSSLSDYMKEDRVFATIADAITFIDEGINLHAKDALQTNT